MFVEHKEHGEVKELDAASNLLLKAAALIEAEGLSIDGMCDDLGRRCVIGALTALDGKCSLAWQEACNRMNEAVTGHKNDCMGPWSDSMAQQGRAAEVVAKVRAVALS